MKSRRQLEASASTELQTSTGAELQIGAPLTCVAPCLHCTPWMWQPESLDIHKNAAIQHALAASPDVTP